MENKRQLESLRQLRPKLQFKDTVLEEECKIADLPKYDMVFFLLTPKQIGNKFFIQAIDEVLRVRRNSKTIFLAIDDLYRLDEQEVLKVTMELRDSLKEIISNPVIFTVSSYYAALYSRYEVQELTLRDIRQNREVMIPTSDGGLVTGKGLNEDDIPQLHTLSNMKSLYGLIQELSKGIHRTGINVSKKNWLVLGREKTGKSSLQELLSARLGDSIHFVDQNPEVAVLDQYYDGLLIVLDLDIERSFKYLEDIYARYVEMDKVIVINKMDEFMFFGKGQHELRQEFQKRIRSLTNDPIYFVSSYYYQHYLRIKGNGNYLDELIQNPTVLLVDGLNFPLSKQKHKAMLPELLFQQTGFEELLHNWE